MQDQVIKNVVSNAFEGGDFFKMTDVDSPGYSKPYARDRYDVYYS